MKRFDRNKRVKCSTCKKRFGVSEIVEGKDGKKGFALFVSTPISSMEQAFSEAICFMCVSSSVLALATALESLGVEMVDALSQPPKKQPTAFKPTPKKKKRSWFHQTFELEHHRGRFVTVYSWQTDPEQVSDAPEIITNGSAVVFQEKSLRPRVKYRGDVPYVVVVADSHPPFKPGTELKMERRVDRFGVHHWTHSAGSEVRLYPPVEENPNRNRSLSFDAYNLSLEETVRERHELLAGVFRQRLEEELSATETSCM